MAVYWKLACMSLVAVGLVAAPLSQSSRAEDQPQASPAAENAKVQVSHVYRVSKLTGMSVKNAKHEELGHIEELVVDARSGDVRYAALSVGGFLGVGDKLFAVPWNSMKLMYKDGEAHAMLNIDPAALKNSTGFDQDNWPNVADPKWGASVDELYQDKTAPAVPNDNTNRTTDKPAAPKSELAQEESSPQRTVYRASTLTGMSVRNPAGQDLGHINELVVDINQGKVRYAALAFGGFLGFGDKLFAIPWDAMKIAHNEDEAYLVLNISPERLKTAPGFNADNWPDTADPAFAAEIDKYYEKERPATKVDVQVGPNTKIEVERK